jgi:hypothetical protein
MAADPLAAPLLPEDDPRAVTLPVPYVSQEPYDNLCWAACCSMVFQKFGLSTVALCSLATEAFGRDCCSSPDPSCDNTHWPDDIFESRSFSHQRGGPLTLANILYEINAGRPVCAVFEWQGGGGHMIAICGYYPNGDVLIKDPMYGEGRVSLDFVAAAYNRGEWSDSYYNLSPDNAT